ncbi:unnamed protein product [Calicophoron daubneyi]|uniref:Uncharacterized protein n=1 Tax=Calicophoron daubneyi TaxID=300641 RepID=A0AAV2TQA0_CALDB
MAALDREHSSSKTEAGSFNTLVARIGLNSHSTPNYGIQNELHSRACLWSNFNSTISELNYITPQISQNLSLRNVQRLQRERDHLHQELSNQIARYEDRLTELHSVIAELRKRLERADAHIIREVDEIEEKEEEEEHEKDAELNERSDAVDAEADEIGSFSGNSPFPPRKNQCNCQLQRETNDSPLLTHNDYCHSDGSSDAGNTSVGAVDGDHPDLPDNDTNYGALRSNKNRLLSAGMDHDGIYNTVGVYSPLQQTQINNSSQVAATSDEAVLQARKRYSIVDYEAALARLQAKLTCVTEERDLLARQLSTASPHSVVAPGDRQSQLPCSHSPTLGQPYHSAPPPSTPTGVPPVTGMCGQLSTQKSTLIPNLSSLGQSQKPGSRSSTAYESPKHFLQNQCCTASAPPQRGRELRKTTGP